MKKAYAINIRFGIWENQLWFSGDDSDEAQKKWDMARLEVDNIAKTCEGSADFTSKLTKHFASCGFTRIQK